MTPQLLLQNLRELLSSRPALEDGGQYASEHYAWLGRARALMNTWDRIEAIPFNHAISAVVDNRGRAYNSGQIQMFIHDLITRTELQLQQSGSAGHIFGPGAAYDFFVALRELVQSASADLFIVDPYLDAEIFDGYLGSLSAPPPIRLLTHRYIADVRTARARYQTQLSSGVEIRDSTGIHDRLVIVDCTQCWVLGASIKDAARVRATYLAPLSDDIAAGKIAIYDALWAQSAPI